MYVGDCLNVTQSVDTDDTM